MLTKQEENLRRLGEIMGVSKERFDEIMKIKQTFKEDENVKNFDNFEIDFTSSATIEEKHKQLLEYMNKTKWYFKNADEVEIYQELINEDVLEIMWKNIHVYTYDIQNFFLDKFIFYLKTKDFRTVNDVEYKAYFSIEDGNIFLLVEDTFGNDFVGGTIAIKDGKFIPVGALNEEYYEVLKQNHIKQGLQFDKEFVANRTLLNILLYIIIVNDMITKNREFVTETSRRINIEPKNNNKKNKKKKKQPKKTVSVRYIKVDGEKIKKISEEKERQLRGAYERHTDQWTKIGHWRHYKSGKKIWIEPTTVKAKNKVGETIPKIYKIK